MTERFNLIKNEGPEVEKRVLPRFPFNFLSFKGQGKEGDRVYEVRDISYRGMQLVLKDGKQPYESGEMINGTLIWRGKRLELAAEVKWVKEKSLGVVFDSTNGIGKKIRDFLSLDNIIAGMRPLHHGPLDLDLPTDLKYWLRADGPVEIFVWQHKDGDLSRFQMILLDKFIEWEDGKGVKTGRLLKHRDIDTPLTHNDEFLFEIDTNPDLETVQFARSIVAKVPHSSLPDAACSFLSLKLAL